MSGEQLVAGVVAVPCTEVMWTRSAASLCRAFRALPAAVDVWMDWCQLPVVAKRNHLVRRFLTQTDREWMIFIDSDMVPPQDALAKLATVGQERNLDILGAHCFTRHGIPFRACGGWVDREGEISWIGPDRWDGQVHEVDWVGTGCVYLSRRVLARMSELIGGNVFRPAAHLEWADRGEDQEFCKTVKIAGFKVWYHTGVGVGHLGLTDISESLVRRVHQESQDEPRAPCDESV